MYENFLEIDSLLAREIREKGQVLFETQDTR
jgi:hypothetical protein